MNDDQIRVVFLTNGFTIKEGRRDLKPYVYDAARALLELNQTAAQAEPNVTDLRNEFKAWCRSNYLNPIEAQDGWCRTVFASDYIESRWEGFYYAKAPLQFAKRHHHTNPYTHT